MRTIQITVSRTVQVKQYEPVSVTISETIELDDDEHVDASRLALYKVVTQNVKRYIENEVNKYSLDTAKPKIKP